MNRLKQYMRGWVARAFRISSGEVSILHMGSGFVSHRTDLDVLCDFLSKLHPVFDDQKELIRLGPEGDGGYLVPDDLEGIEACFSPGVSSVSGFEKDCAARGMEVFLADQSVEGPAEEHERFHFTKKYIGALSNDDYLTLDDWVSGSQLSAGSDLLLQMDIEGAEYESLLRISNDLLSRFRIIVIEFHSLDQLLNAPFFQLASRAFDKILQTHRCVHIHPNNYSKVVRSRGLEFPEMMEFTFVRNDHLVEPRPVTRFPHKLDRDCTQRPSLVLPECWHQELLDGK